MNYEGFFEEIITKFPKFKIGNRFEVLNNFYHKNEILAESSKSKKINNFRDFLNKKAKGDILIVKKTEENTAICENLNNGNTVIISYYDILENNVKNIKRLRK